MMLDKTELENKASAILLKLEKYSTLLRAGIIPQADTEFQRVLPNMIKTIGDGSVRMKEIREPRRWTKIQNQEWVKQFPARLEVADKALETAIKDLDTKFDETTLLQAYELECKLFGSRFANKREDDFWKDPRMTAYSEMIQSNQLRAESIQKELLNTNSETYFKQLKSAIDELRRLYDERVSIIADAEAKYKSFLESELQEHRTNYTSSWRERSAFIGKARDLIGEATALGLTQMEDLQRTIDSLNGMRYIENESSLTVETYTNAIKTISDNIAQGNKLILTLEQEVRREQETQAKNADAQRAALEELRYIQGEIAEEAKIFHQVAAGIKQELLGYDVATGQIEKIESQFDERMKPSQNSDASILKGDLVILKGMTQQLRKEVEMQRVAFIKQTEGKKPQKPKEVLLARYRKGQYRFNLQEAKLLAEVLGGSESDLGEREDFAQKISILNIAMDMHDDAKSLSEANNLIFYINGQDNSDAMLIQKAQEYEPDLLTRLDLSKLNENGIKALRSIPGNDNILLQQLDFIEIVSKNGVYPHEFKRFLSSEMTVIRETVLDLKGDDRSEVSSKLLDVLYKMSQDPLVKDKTPEDKTPVDKKRAMNRILQGLIAMGSDAIEALHTSSKFGADPLILIFADYKELFKQGTIESCTPFIELLMPSEGYRKNIADAFFNSDDARIDTFFEQKKSDYSYKKILDGLKQQAQNIDELKVLATVMNGINQFVGERTEEDQSLNKMRVFQWATIPILLSTNTLEDKHQKLCSLAKDTFPHEKNIRTFFIWLFNAVIGRFTNKMNYDNPNPEQQDIKNVLQTMKKGEENGSPPEPRMQQK